ncbi:MAG: HlyD family efflux transporter periplasmic adaptor subunit [Flavobacteriales bacterium]|nr:HlyD family efflux transporter periplasmic adaptor subunit [Flavobacteriales bacterium]
MLNISKNRIEGKVIINQYTSFSMLKNYSSITVLSKVLLASFIAILFILFLPWTQNIRSRGYVTTLQPDQRPQTINSVIAGKIEKWFVREGDFVNKGDTILFISEIKDDYFDPNLLSRTEEQIKAKELAVKSYMEKVNSLDAQIDALFQTKKLKIEQAKNYIKQSQLKVLSDSVDLEAAKTNYQIAEKQFKRQEELYEQGLKSLTDLESRKLKLQETQSKLISAENKLLTSRNELINAQVEINSINNQYIDKLSKAESDKYTAMSSMYDAEAIVTKMQNQYMNYSVRQGMYYITAPQDGYITKAIRSGIGETLKEGEEMVSIMPAKYDLAVEMYIKPFDLPLISKGQKVRFMFDGWPSVVFSGWPNISYGTFGGVVVAIDNFISENGKYRILVAPDKNDVKWPDGLRVGSGANGMALLKDVSIWYELWRNLNGFPPDYYEVGDKINKADKKKK